MNKVTVTKEQMETIRQCKRFAGTYNLAFITNKDNDFLCWAKPLNKMTIEQIVLAWHGHAEVELEYVCFDEAMRASNEGKKSLFNVRNLTYELYPNHEISKTWAAKYSLLDLFNGKFTIEGDNQ